MGRSSGRERKQEHNECGRVWGVFMHIIHERRSGGGAMVIGSTNAVHRD